MTGTKMLHNIMIPQRYRGLRVDTRLQLSSLYHVNELNRKLRSLILPRARMRNALYFTVCACKRARELSSVPIYVLRKLAHVGF